LAGGRRKTNSQVPLYRLSHWLANGNCNDLLLYQDVIHRLARPTGLQKAAIPSNNLFIPVDRPGGGFDLPTDRKVLDVKSQADEKTPRDIGVEVWRL